MILFFIERTKSSAIAEVAAQCCVNRIFAFEWGTQSLHKLWRYHHEGRYTLPVFTALVQMCVLV